jgi:hypothetical protein
MTSYLIWSLFTHSDKIEILGKIVHQLQAAKTIIEKRTSYETTFAGSTRMSQYFRLASVLRYKLFDITTRVKKEKEEKGEKGEEEEKLKANEKLRSRYSELDFRVFCFIATYLPPSQMALIDDEAWPYFIQWVFEYIQMMEIPEKFAVIAVLRLQKVSPELANAFEKEWNDSLPVWIKYHNLLYHQITKQQTNLNKELEELVQYDKLAPNELLQKIGELKARYSGELIATATQLKGEISLSKEKREQHKIRLKIRLKKENEQLGVDLKNGLNEIAQRNRGLEGRLEDMERFIAHFERRLSMEERASPISLGL